MGNVIFLLDNTKLVIELFEITMLLKNTNNTYIDNDCFFNEKLLKINNLFV